MMCKKAVTVKWELRPVPTGTGRCSYFIVTRCNSLSDSILGLRPVAANRAADRSVGGFSGHGVRFVAAVSGKEVRT
jgi:hypothetical protein